jgi:hypothetical protein
MVRPLNGVMGGVVELREVSERGNRYPTIK